MYILKEWSVWILHITNAECVTCVILFVMDFVFFFNFYSCPYDSLTVYDGGTRHAPVLGKFCGEHGPVTFFSSGAHLFIEFVTRAGRIGDASNQYDSSVDYKFNRRGFNVSFTFRHDLVTIGQWALKELLGYIYLLMDILSVYESLIKGLLTCFCCLQLLLSSQNMQIIPRPL